MRAGIVLVGLCLVIVNAQIQFEIPADMMGGGGYGQVQQQQQQQPQKRQIRWPNGIASEIEPEFEWLCSTQWKGKSATYTFLHDNEMESTLKECKHEGACAWTAGKGKLYINTPTLGVIAFDPSGSKAFEGDADAQKNLDDHAPSELAKIEWTAVKPGPAGRKSKLAFKQVVTSQEEEGMIAEDLYEILGISATEEQAQVKRKYRRLSVQSHPDKCSSAEKAACEARFEKIRQAYEILNDKNQRAYYDLGGVRLVRNVESGWKEVEGQKAQLDAQINQVPANHPMRGQVEAQVRQQKAQLSESRMRPQLEKKFTSEEMDVEVPVTLKELYEGTWKKTFEFPRLVICRGCRAEPNSERCKKCGRCPPEKKQIPQFANTIFGRQVVGHKEKMVESNERCATEPTKITGLKVGRGASPGTHMKSQAKVGHQAPGRLPGTVHFKLAYAEDPMYLYAGQHLYSVLSITLSEALHGFQKEWLGPNGRSKVTLKRNKAFNGQVLRIARKGMFNPGESEPYGDIVVRIHVQMPSADTVKIEKPTADKTADLSAENQVEVKETGEVWRHYYEAEDAILSTDTKTKHHEEL